MELKALILDSKPAWVEYPGLRGFEVEVVNLSRKELMALRKRCMITKLDRKAGGKIEELDDEKFIREFTRATVKDWKGLKAKYLETLILADIGDTDPEAEVNFTPENAEVLVSGSADFDSWLNDTVFDLDNFRSPTKGATVPASGKVAK